MVSAFEESFPLRNQQANTGEFAIKLGFRKRVEFNTAPKTACH